MKRATIFALSSLVSVLSLTGCIAGEEDMIDPDLAHDVELGELGPPPPQCVKPPEFDTTVGEHTGGDVGNGITVSSPDASYYSAKGNYVVEVTNLNQGAAVHNAAARPADAPISKFTCEHTTTTATLYGYIDSDHCWKKIGATKSKLGVYSAVEPCDDAVSWNILPTASKLRIQGNTVFQNGGLTQGRKISEGTYWFY